MASAYFTSSKVGNVLLGRIEQEKVSDREVPVITSEFSDAAPMGKWRAALDLSPVTMLTSTGLGLLVTLNKLCKANGGRLIIFGMSPEIHQLVKLTHLHKLLTIVTGRDEALQLVAA